MPWRVTSIRIMFGRFCSMTTGTSMPGPSVMVPVVRMRL